MFVNCSNHPFEMWGDKEKTAAQAFGEIVDYPFPQVSADADEQAVAVLAERTAREIAALEPDMVLCQGEFTLTYGLICRLKAMGIPTAAACSERMVREERQPDGSVKRVSCFRFVRFRCY